LVELFGCLFLLFGFFAAVLHVWCLNCFVWMYASK
jgi:hypothetical protein